MRFRGLTGTDIYRLDPLTALIIALIMAIFLEMIFIIFKCDLNSNLYLQAEEAFFFSFYHRSM